MRPIDDVIEQLRRDANNPSISTTLIQTEDLLNLCNEVERLRAMIGETNHE